jgi:cellulose biosynthesis protein BcsQ
MAFPSSRTALAITSKQKFRSRRNTVKLGEAPLVGRPITAYAGSSEAARTYRELAREVIDLGQA